jgi:hypothetical protein
LSAARPPAPTSSSNLNGVLTATSNTATANGEEEHGDESLTRF